MTEHVEEPWTFHENGDANHYAIMAGGRWLISLLLNGELMRVKQIATLRRIVACVNACAGIPTDALEQCLATFPDTPAGRLKMLHHIAGFASGDGD